MRTSRHHHGRPGRLRAFATNSRSALLVTAALAAGDVSLPQTVQNAEACGPVSGVERGLVGTITSQLSAQEPAEPLVSIGGLDVPNPLRLGDGNCAGSTEVWEGVRREELLADFRQHVYGESLPAPVEQTFDVSENDAGGVTRKNVEIGITGPEGSGSFEMKLFVPDGQTPRGTFLMIDHRGSVGDDPGDSSDYAPVGKVTEAGYAFAHIDANGIAPDDSGSYRDGVIDLFHPSGEDLPENAGRTISAWAWGASRAMDYLETDPDIDPAKVAVIGHSRSGKASLWAGAQDTRFAAAITNNSGSTGAKMARRGEGETVSAINGQFPHWFPETYREYNDNEDALPVDQHELMALVAPRRIVVGSATEDGNADPQGEFLSYVGAAQVYDLYGLGDTGLPSDDWQPDTDQGFRGPAMSYHLRSGGHGLQGADWDIYLDGNLFER
ncbi:acetylxylan esterase [Pseudonocardia nematodicida]|uniref:Acetylxylan esterase n=1 Tax=Pseudonocardia nematodicida TaxID=1206997 RepID=A0ABV1K8K8_9PSEU